MRSEDYLNNQVPGTGLPCDLPLNDKRSGEHNPLGRLWHDPSQRRTLLIAVIAALAVIIVVLAILLARGCDSREGGPVTQAAAAGVAQVMAQAVQTGQEAHAKAVRGEGPVTGVVCIDAGHGGGADLTLTPIGPGSSEMQYVEPGGTSGVATGREEAVVTLEIAQQLAAKLRDAGVTVVMVRDDNEQTYSSEQRAAIANAAGADIFVRLHCDGSEDPGLRGFSTLIPGYNDWTASIVDSSAQAASIMHPIVVAETGAPDMGVVERYDLAGFNFCEVPSVLFEMGFMSNYDEDLLLSDPVYQDTMAQALCDATLAYLEAVSG